MNCWKWIFSTLQASIFLLVSGVCNAMPDFSTVPTDNAGQKWRVGYYQGGEYPNYYHHLSAIVKGLMELGWIEEAELPENLNQDSQVLWEWLVRWSKSSYVEFVADGFYTADWDNAARVETRNNLISRLNIPADIDLMLAMGTWAGKDLANDQHRTPSIVTSTSDPLRAGIIQSYEDSGFDHLHVQVDPTRYKRQVMLFHDLIGFKKLGIAYENTFDGRSYAAIEQVESLAQERGFEVVSCYTQSDIADLKLAGKTVIDCFQRLAATVDAIYVTVQGGVNDETIPELVRIANRNRVATFSQYGRDEVRYGYLLSLTSPEGLQPEGRFLAKNIAQIFNGATARQLNQVFEDTSSIVLNLKTAEEIGLFPSADLLAAADYLYWQIEKPNE